MAACCLSYLWCRYGRFYYFIELHRSWPFVRTGEVMINILGKKVVHKSLGEGLVTALLIESIYQYQDGILLIEANVSIDI